MSLWRFLCTALAAATLGLASGAGAPAWAQDAAGCGSPPVRSDGWLVAAPEQAGMDAKILCGIGPRFAAWPDANAHAVLVARHGKLVYERYFAGADQIWGQPIGTVTYDAEKRHDLRSITKSVTSLLVGIALDHGWLKSLDAPVLSFLPEFSDLSDPDKEHITLRHLLTMSSGLAWDESRPYSDPTNSERQMDAAADPYRYALAQPMAAPPGTIYNYCGCSAALLEDIIQQTASRPLDGIAKEFLFDPLGISDVEWTRFPNGDVLAHGGLRLRARDLAKLGQLVLKRGDWNGRRIVSTAWIDQATAPQINGESIYFYGYQWWLGRSLIARKEIDWIAGFGYGGQRLYIVPKQDLVVVVYSGAYGAPPLVGNIVLNQYVLPALIDKPTARETQP
ncbi:MAG TPA: serine hydrolase [Stellaceae bacterium]|nr:serine hydrolase [Stellaceae bacterium]